MYVERTHTDTDNENNMLNRTLDRIETSPITERIANIDRRKVILSGLIFAVVTATLPYLMPNQFGWLAKYMHHHPNTPGQVQTMPGTLDFSNTNYPEAP